MKKIILLLVISLIFLPKAGFAGLANDLKGKILLQVEENGEAWYVNPIDLNRYYLGRPADAFNLMRELGLGIKNEELNQYLITGFPNRLSGKILLDVEKNGEAYYVYPQDLKGYYLGRPNDAFDIMREKGLGISNIDLKKIIIKAETTMPTAIEYEKQSDHSENISLIAEENKCTSLDNLKIKNYLDANQALAKSKNILGTPTTIINGYKIMGAGQYQYFKDIVDDILQENKVDSEIEYVGDLEINDLDPIIGNVNNQIKLVIFTDYQCPYCALHHRVIVDLLNEYPEDIFIVYKPMAFDFHQYAQYAAIAAVCANNQGQFESMHQKLFDLSLDKKLNFESIDNALNLLNIN